MVSLGTYQACSPAEDLQPSQGRNKQQQQQYHAHRARKANLFLKVGTWNVRSMVDTEGSIEVASQTNGKRGEDRKVDQVVGELARYDVVVGALQET